MQILCEDINTPNGPAPVNNPSEQTNVVSSSVAGASVNGKD